MKLATRLEQWRNTKRDKIKIISGSFQPPKGKSILICADGAPSEWVENFMKIFRETNPRENIFVIDGGIPDFPLTNGASIPYPMPLFWMTRRFLRRLRVRMILVDNGVRPPPYVLTSALNNDISIAYLEHCSERGRDARDSKVEQSCLVRPIIIEGLEDRSGHESIDIIAPIIAREMEVDSNLKKKVKLYFWNRLGFKLSSSRLHKLNSFAEIGASLGNPESILCLGNGPSSEDSLLLNKEYDSIFRVNHRWLDRGIFTAPDAIFTGALDSVLQVGRNVLYAFIDDARSMRIIRKAAKKLDGLSFTNVTDLGFPIGEFLPYQPTNGLVMIYVAVKLRPHRLTIAGIDLYRDPRGCYPGESSTPNGYTSGHAADRELDLMLRMLASYKGNLTIIGDQLASEYERYISKKTNEN